MLEFVRSGNWGLAGGRGIPRAEMSTRLNFARRQGIPKADVVGEGFLAADRTEREDVNCETQRIPFLAGNFDKRVVGDHFANPGGGRALRVLRCFDAFIQWRDLNAQSLQIDTRDIAWAQQQVEIGSTKDKFLRRN